MERLKGPARPAAREMEPTGARAWWKVVFPWLQPSATPGPRREVWNPEVRAQYRSAHLPGLVPLNLLPVSRFSRRLLEEFAQAQQTGQPLAVVVYQLPKLTPEGWRQMEIALRGEVRRDDLPARLGVMTVAVVLPRTGAVAARVALRTERILSQVVANRVLSGIAIYPEDSSPTAMELLRTATWRSLQGLPARRQDPNLELLLGPLAPPPRSTSQARGVTSVDATQPPIQASSDTPAA